ncbi:hypothetical protein KIW84_057764 [Lathyrus oleraceus]|uniref:Uncharacterized protein n=1 Tax=Pisum sativum TaxID=3888 RepID=A0A9D4X460_PEA|nr:hypothetical protein KIW84_057764 [Pisum sativum]
MDVEKALKNSADDDKEMEMYHRAEEALINFLETCELSDAKTMLCSRCGAIFNERIVKKVEETRIHDLRKGERGGKDGAKSRIRSPEYVPQPVEKYPEYVPQLDDEW